MASIFDLMPASLWPVQPFIPPFDPAQPTMWPSGASGWTPPPSSPAPGWSAISADAPPAADSSVSDWDRAMRQALAAQRDVPSDPGVGGIAPYDQMLADAKRAHDFVRWVLGPPSAPLAQPVGAAMPRGGAQPTASGPQNVVTTSAAAPPSVVSAPGADDADTLPPGLTDQRPDLGAAYGNPNIMRQGAKAREIAATRPRPAALADFVSSIPRGVVQGLADTASASGQQAQIEMQQPVNVPSGDAAMGIVEQNLTGPLPKPQGVAGQFGETLGEFLGNPASYVGPGGLWANLFKTSAAALASETAGQVTKNTWAEPIARFAAAVLGDALAGLAVRPSALQENNRILYDLAWKKLRDLDPTNPLLDDRPNRIPTIADRKLLNDETKRIRTERGGGEPEENHWFVQQFRPWFEQQGINPNDFTTFMSFNEHRAKGTGVHAKPFLLNRRWLDFREDKPNATANQMHRQLYNILQEWLEQ
jgi:hypothetical protein